MKNDLRSCLQQVSHEQAAPVSESLEKQLLQKNKELLELNQRLLQEIEERKRVEQSLLQSERKYRKVVESSSDIIGRFDKNLRHIFVNDAVEAAFGLPKQQLIGKSHQELNLPEYVLRETRDRIQEVFRTGQKETSITYLPTPEGLRCFHSVIEPELSEAGTVETVVAIGRDLTMEALKEQMLNSVFDNTRIGITSLHAVRDEQGHIVDFEWMLANKSAAAILGQSSSELINKRILSLFPGIKATGLFDFMVQVVEQGGAHSQSLFYNHEHLNAWFDLLISKLADGVILTFVDISEQRKTALALKHTNQELLQEVQERKTAERRLQQEHELLERIIEHSVDCICAFDERGYYTAWNRMMEVYTGFKREQVLGRHIFDVHPHLKDTKVAQKVKQVLQGRSCRLKAVPFMQRPGSYELNLVPTFDAEQQQTGGIIFMRDLAESLKLKEMTIQHRLSQQKNNLQVVLQTQEEERKRIAEALHNGLGQLLYGIKLHLEQAKGAGTGAVARIQEIALLLEEAITETRTISFELMPSILQDFGLEVALQEFCKKLSRTHITINLKEYNAAARFDANLEIAVYRMVQELVNNCIKHAGATLVEIEVVQAKGKLRLQVRDNGKGADTAKLKKCDGIGLRSIRNRLKLLNGRLRINAEAGKGTAVTLQVPL